MDPRYDHAKYEADIYKLWEKSNAFAPKKSGHQYFSVIMPPPNANDPLHIGHAMFVTIEDILIRYHRMKGNATLWLPGTDHAGIETQYVFEKKLSKEGKSRYDFDRQTLYKKIWDYVQENSGAAVNQMKKLGASADWGRFKFTLDKDIVKSVIETFINLYKDGLVYRGERLVNCCVKCGTSYSELEIEHEEKEEKLYFIKYPLIEGDFITVATTRPETMLGDTAVAVNPKDKRYKDFVGKNVKLPLTDRIIPIIADEFVEKEFGTGAVKITPAHDHNDYETGKRHNLPLIQVIDFDGKINKNAPGFEGLNLSKVRQEVLAKLGQLNLLESVKDHKNVVGTCYRCHSVIEPLPLAQFFVKTKPLAEKAIKALDKKEAIILGAGREKILREWLVNIKDWNISRQIVWGIRIPAWYSIEKNPEIEVGFINRNKEFTKGKISDLLKKFDFEEIENGLQYLRADKDAEFEISTQKPKGQHLQETDTFDTWFSSGQWPVVTLKNSQKGDFENFYPTSVMDTGYDILTRWVMRMMLLGIYATGKSPFKYVYLHGLVRDEKGRKMSKSIGNVINPLDVIKKYGADALRMALVIGTTPGNDSNVGENKIRGMRNLSNKIWNAARYVISMPDNIAKGEKDDELLENLQENVVAMTKKLDKLQIGQAAEWIYNWFWHIYCDDYIEKSKKGLVSKRIMLEALKTNLILLHPFMPFVTETIWSLLKNENPAIASPWPKA